MDDIFIIYRQNIYNSFTTEKYVNYINKNNWVKLSLISIGELDRNMIKNFSKSLVLNNSNNKKEIDLIFSPQELKNSMNSDLKIVCLSPGKLTFGQLEEFRKYIYLFNLKLDGILVINNDV